MPQSALYCIFVSKYKACCSIEYCTVLVPVSRTRRSDHNEIHLCALSIGFQHISIVPSFLTPSTCAQKSLQYIYVQRVLVSRDLSFLWEWEGSAPSSHFSLFTKFPSLFSLPPISQNQILLKNLKLFPFHRKALLTYSLPFKLSSSHSLAKPFSSIPPPSSTTFPFPSSSPPSVPQRRLRIYYSYFIAVATFI